MADFEEEVGGKTNPVAAASETNPVAAAPEDPKPTATAIHSRRDIAIDFLSTALRKGPVAVAELEHLAWAAGLLTDQEQISQSKAFRTARKALAIQPYQRDRHWVWALAGPVQMPSDASSDAPDVTTDSATALSHAQGASESSSSAGPMSDAAPPGLALAEGVARLDPLRPPIGVSRQRWRQFVDDCARFLAPGGKDWAARAALLGWDILDLFGIDGAHLMRPERLGLLWFVAGGRIVELDHDAALIETLAGAQKVYRRRTRSLDSAQMTLPWNL